MSANDLATDTPLTVQVNVGSFSVAVGTISIAGNLNLLIILLPVFACVIVLSVAVFIVLVAVFCRNTRKKDQRYNQLILDLEKMESSVASECKLGEYPQSTSCRHAHLFICLSVAGFAELQTDLDDITDIAGCRLPYRDIQNYLLTTLFPGARDHPVLHPIQVQNQNLS